MKPPTPRCKQCDALLNGPRLVVEGWWWCPDCVYEREYGPAERKPSEPRKQPQAETLFPLPQAHRGRL